MSRIRIELPRHFVFRTELTVRVSDLNYAGHVGNDRVLTLMQEARVMYYKSLGFDETRFDENIVQLIADAAIIYKAESFLGDVLSIEIAAADLTSSGFGLFYRITNALTLKEIAHGKTGIVCFDRTLKKVAPVPDLVAQKLGLRV
jgi:acyl-CoA thioester hydrolase